MLNKLGYFNSPLQKAHDRASKIVDCLVVKKLPIQSNEIEMYSSVNPKFKNLIELWYKKSLDMWKVQKELKLKEISNDECTGVFVLLITSLVNFELSINKYNEAPRNPPNVNYPISY